ncbi:hypothetical protein [Marinirhabdus gelatinilytica]|uniref:Uncharacterized protein n=1 Tax=Marinirhabdus gelatinilytica TaxID=1703343 RepID=A0A370QB06_9FLAO|nr:hypothetical protein [Marinirhabdus gelatinilytica]RDK85556.1 hypothetical protein C8D94_103383 [Marinirhabdus gelatinilytica]
MKPATAVQIRKELKFRSKEELEQLCLRLSRFKKENKELLTYLLFEADHEDSYVEEVKDFITQQFKEIPATNFYRTKKRIRKILRETKKFIRYSSVKETEVALLLHFCDEMIHYSNSVKRSKTMLQLYERQLALIEKKIAGLHEDLQMDYISELKELPRHNL